MFAHFEAFHRQTKSLGHPLASVTVMNRTTCVFPKETRLKFGQTFRISHVCTVYPQKGTFMVRDKRLLSW